MDAGWRLIQSHIAPRWVGFTAGTATPASGCPNAHGSLSSKAKLPGKTLRNKGCFSECLGSVIDSDSFSAGSEDTGRVQIPPDLLLGSFMVFLRAKPLALPFLLGIERLFRHFLPSHSLQTYFGKASDSQEKLFLFCFHLHCCGCLSSQVTSDERKLSFHNCMEQPKILPGEV